MRARSLRLAKPVKPAKPVSPRRWITQRDAYLAFIDAGGAVFWEMMIAVKDGEVFNLAGPGDWRRLPLLGPLAGARVEAADSWQLWLADAKTGVSGPVDVKNAKLHAELAEFNAMAQAATPEPPLPAPVLAAWECVYCRTVNAADQDRCSHCGAPVRLSKLHGSRRSAQQHEAA